MTDQSDQVKYSSAINQFVKYAEEPRPSLHNCFYSIARNCLLQLADDVVESSAPLKLSLTLPVTVFTPPSDDKPKKTERTMESFLQRVLPPPPEEIAAAAALQDEENAAGKRRRRGRDGKQNQLAQTTVMGSSETSTKEVKPQQLTDSEKPSSPLAASSKVFVFNCFHFSFCFKKNNLQQSKQTASQLQTSQSESTTTQPPTNPLTASQLQNTNTNTSLPTTRIAGRRKRGTRRIDDKEEVQTPSEPQVDREAEMLKLRQEQYKKEFAKQVLFSNESFNSFIHSFIHSFISFSSGFSKSKTSSQPVPLSL